MREMFGPLSDDDAHAMVREKEAIYRELFAPVFREIAGFTAFARAAKAAGVRIACATAGDPDNIAFAVAGLRLHDFFDAAVGAHDVARGKPEPDLFLLAAARIGRRAGAIAWCSRMRRSESKAPGAPGCAPSRSPRAFPPTSSARPPTSSRGRKTSRRSIPASSPNAFSPDHTTGAHGPMENASPPPAAAADENQIIAERRAKLAALRAQGQPFPNDFRRDALAADLHAQHGAKTNEELEPLGIRVAVAGRMMLKRVMGKASFATIQDMTGRIQLYVTADAIGADAHDAFKHWDLGDLVGATGHAVQDEDRRAVGQGRVDPPAGEVAAAAAGEVPRARRPGAALPAALRRSHHQPGFAPRVRRALADRAGDPRVLRRARLSRGRDADDAPDSGRRRGAAVRRRTTTRSTWSSSCASRPSCT